MNWIDDLKPGDKVAVSSRTRLSVETVERLTKLYVIAGGRKYKRKDGCLVGGTMWGITHLAPVTPEVLSEINERKLRNRLIEVLEGVNPKTIPLSEAERLLTFLEQMQGEQA